MPLSVLHRAAWLSMPPTAFSSLVSLILYFAYRLKCLLSAHRLLMKREGTFVAQGTTSLALAWLFLAVEFFAILPNALPYLLRVLAIQQPNREAKALRSGDGPTVDILITCCNEDVDVIMDTARAACVLDYPRDRYRVFVCDDGASKAVRQQVDLLALSYSNIYYTARRKGPVKDYKAGNLNHGLLLSSMTPRALHNCKEPDLPARALDFREGLRSNSTLNNIFADGGSQPMSCSSTPSIGDKSNLSIAASSTMSEYVAGLDADMIPEPHWLRSLLPHLIEDPKVALVCPPQTFYDIPLNDPLTQTMSQFAGITEIVHDALGHADCLGSGYLVRRAAINSIGGFPTSSLSEDVCCSATLLGAGWKTAFIQQPLQYGLVPESLLGHIKQRTRWFVGHVQTALLFKFRLGRRGRHLTLAQRLVGVAFDLRQLVQVPLALSYVTIPFALLSGYPLVIWTNTFELVWLTRLVVIWTLCHWTHQAVMGAIAGFGNGWYDVRMPSYDAQLEQWMGPYILVAFFRSFVVPKRLGGTIAGFTSTGSIQNDMQERDIRNRAPLSKRLRVMLVHQWVLIHVIFVLACLAGVGLTLARCLGLGVPSTYDVHIPRTTQGRLIYLLVRIGWPPLLWLQHSISALDPILYMLSPPATANRENLLSRDPKTGVAYPIMEARHPRKSAMVGWRYARVAVASVYTIVLLGAGTRLQSD